MSEPPLELLVRGKVREVYALDPERVLLVASDRISAFDHVLSPAIPDKGRVLTALTLWWLEQLPGVAHHVLSAELPAGLPAQWAGRALVCRRLAMVPVECVARGYLTGSGLADYRRDATVGGHPLPAGLRDGDPLPEPIFTPATKAAVGEHDQNLTVAELSDRLGSELTAELERRTLDVYARAAAIARARGLLLVDTKLEFGHTADGELVLGDELLTPDSSRYWPAEQWVPGQAQPSVDKQGVRDWLAAHWDLGGQSAPPELPPEVVADTRARYLGAYRQLTGRGLEAPA